MAFFQNSDQFYEMTRALFAQLQAQEPNAMDTIAASHLIARLRCTDPEAEITLNGRQRPVQTTFGPSAVRATLDIELPADILHRIMLGEESLKTALARGQIQVRGPVWRVRVLADLFRKAQTIYPQILAGQGVRVSADPL